MKKKILITLIALASILFTSCFDPIYGTIRTDVKPEKPTVSGDINTIVRYTVNNKEYLVLSANGGLRYKEADNDSHGSWATYGGLPFPPIHTDYEHEPFLGEKIIKVASDDTTLYLVTVQFNKEGLPHSPKLYAGIVKDWNTATTWNQLKLPVPTSVGETPSEEVSKEKDLSILPIKIDEKYALGGFNIFSSNDIYSTHNVDTSKRVAYLRYGDPRAFLGKNPTADQIKLQTPVLYKLSALGMKPVAESDINYLVYDPKNKEKSLDQPTNGGINSVVQHNGKPYFLNTPFASFARFEQSTDVYFALGSNIYHGRFGPTGSWKLDKNENETTVASIDVGRKIASIAICYDAVLVGCGSAHGDVGGIKKVNRDSNGTLTGMGSFTTNAPTQMPPTYLVQALINVDPTKYEKDSKLYSAVSFSGIGLSSSNRVENIGLWSYYPSRGNWNRE